MPSAASVVTPIGPFCPFRSASCAIGGAMDGQISRMESAVGPSFETEMARMQLDFSQGREPKREKVKALADNLSAAYSEWETMMTRWRLSSDFQVRRQAPTAARECSICLLQPHPTALAATGWNRFSWRLCAGYVPRRCGPVSSGVGSFRIHDCSTHRHLTHSLSTYRYSHSLSSVTRRPRYGKIRWSDSIPQVRSSKISVDC